MKFDTTAVLNQLGIESINSGAYCSEHDWSKINETNSFSAFDPCTEEELARISSATGEDNDRRIRAAIEKEKSWRMVPAPQRGKLVARTGELMSEKVSHQFMEARSCHFNAAKLYSEDPHAFKVVTGYALLDDGVWRQHSWGLSNERIVETTFVQEKYYGILLDPVEAIKFVFCNMGKDDAVRLYIEHTELYKELT